MYKQYSLLILQIENIILKIYSVVYCHQFLAICGENIHIDYSYGQFKMEQF